MCCRPPAAPQGHISTFAFLRVKALENWQPFWGLEEPFLNICIHDSALSSLMLLQQRISYCLCAPSYTEEIWSEEL